MNNVIQALTNLASDASLISEQTVAQMLANTDITKLQRQAIANADAKLLAETINLPAIKMFFPVIAAEEDEAEQIIENTNQNVVNT